MELLLRVGVALSAETDTNRLLEKILLEAKDLTRADGGTLYIRRDDDQLHFAIMRTDSLGVALGGTTGQPINLPPIPLKDAETGEPNHRHVASYAALLKQSINIPNAYDTTRFDFSGTKAFDARSGYRSVSFLTIPMTDAVGRVVGVLQLLNSRHPETGEVVAFGDIDQQTVEVLASQAGVSLQNKLLRDAQRDLLESFIRMIASAIDAKSDYTGGHCARVPVIAEMLARAACDARTGPFATFDLTELEWYELHIACWLHDCGKVVTPVHVMDKSKKLETIFDRIETVRARFEVLKRDARLDAYERERAGEDSVQVRAELDAELAALADDLAFLEKTNFGGEFLPREGQERIKCIALRSLEIAGRRVPLLSEEEVQNLSVSRGTLTEKERLVINAHMVHTVNILNALPFPPQLRRVPEYATGHHEKMDGTGYPRGIYAGDMSVPARIMAVADVFEALTAMDRPYKQPKKLSEVMVIMGKMKEQHHLDPEVFDLFIASGTYRKYAEQHLPPELCDAVDEAKLLALKPPSLSLPPEDERRQRFGSVLPEYREWERDYTESLAGAAAPQPTSQKLL
ncbi:MAG TPA: HD domain-containing phosphohydrolase [Polyangiaceae bacterium]|nr:HD domain-containing phosphohydrolase [Polyangiaceae bacterium]